MDAGITQAVLVEDVPLFRELYLEYLQWFFHMFNQDFGVNVDLKDITTTVERDVLQLDKFMPPRGRLLLCYTDETLAGMGCMRDIGRDIGEIKRMYIRPAFRRCGLGRALLIRLENEAKLIGYKCLRLDSARFMKEAHQLYHALGFHEIAQYEESEIISEFPKEFHGGWIFMEKTLG